MQVDNKTRAQGAGGQSKLGTTRATDSIRTEQLLSPKVLAMKPLTRHIAFFDGDGNGRIPPKEMSEGLQKLGIGRAQATLIGLGTVLVRGPKTSGKLEIDVENAMASAQRGRSKIVDANGDISQTALEQMIKDLGSPKGEFSQQNFDALGKKLAAERHPGKLEGIARAQDERQFHTAWKTLLDVAGREGPDGKKFLTANDVRWFYDGSLFYRRAMDLQAAK